MKDVQSPLRADQEIFKGHTIQNSIDNRLVPLFFIT